MKKQQKKLRIGILFGGKSGEHEISLRSAASILQAIDRKKYDVVPLGITKTGRWLHNAEAENLLCGSTSKLLTGSPTTQQMSIHGAAAGTHPAGLDVVFPVLHGTFGEDGTIQGLFELADIAYVGSGVLGSSAGMDKDAMKLMFFATGLPMTPHVTLLRSEWKADPKKSTRAIEKKLTYPVFVKPANLGSSVGISKVKSRKDLAAAMDLAASFDRKIVIEQGVGGPGVKPRELEVAVLGNDNPEASIVGEIVPAKEFYDYEAKYELNGADESVSIIPAKLTAAESKKIRVMAIEAFRACDCSGLARVDFLMAPAAKTKGGKTKPAEILLNEINTMPGFTSISMYPKLWAASGISYPKLIDKLIQLALQRHKEKQQTHFSR
jgi:D-alanine-D-alanine ligase